MDECCCDYHHGLWMTCHHCTQRLEDDFFSAIICLVTLGENVDRFVYDPRGTQEIKSLLDLSPADMVLRVLDVRKLVLEQRKNR